MGLDIRLPIGLLFVTIGALLTVFGFLGDPAIYAQSLGVNINLGWGLILLIFGFIMLYLGSRRKSRRREVPSVIFTLTMEL